MFRWCGVREPIPVGKRGVREGCLAAREACFCTGYNTGSVLPVREIIPVGKRAGMVTYS